MSAPAFGYLNLPADLVADTAHTGAASERLQECAAGNEYTLARTYIDTHDHGDHEFYEMFEALGRGEAVAVIVPDLTHLQACACFQGADDRAMRRYLRTRIVVANKQAAAAAQPPRVPPTNPDGMPVRPVADATETDAAEPETDAAEQNAAAEQSTATDGEKPAGTLGEKVAASAAADDFGFFSS